MKPVLLYGSESLNKKSQRNIIKFENKILRRIYEPTTNDGRINTYDQEGRIRKNKEFQEINKEPDVIVLLSKR